MESRVSDRFNVETCVDYKSLVIIIIIVIFSRMKKIGELGEQFIAQYLARQGWKILHHHWYCRWGEIDLIAQSQQGSDQIAFIEVKTRKKYNWDENGLLAITPSKQAKLWKTAESFLTNYPQLAEYSCRFDVALVTYTLNHPLAGYQFTLQQYLESAFM